MHLISLDKSKKKILLGNRKSSSMSFHTPCLIDIMCFMYTSITWIYDDEFIVYTMLTCIVHARNFLYFSATLDILCFIEQ